MSSLPSTPALAGVAELSGACSQVLGILAAEGPSLERALWLNLMMEAAGAVMLVWAYRRFGLADADRRTQLVRTGQLTDFGPIAARDGKV